MLPTSTICRLTTVTSTGLTAWMAPATGMGQKYREQTYAAIDYLLTSQVIEEQAFRACLGSCGVPKNTVMAA